MSFWVDATSSMILDRCGETTLNPIPQLLPFVVCKDNKVATAMDTTATWAHNVNHTHWLKLDLGKPHYITNIRGVLNITTNVQHIAFYVSNDLTSFGNAVLEVNDWQSYSKGDADPWEYRVNTPKVGRYVLIQVLSTTDANNYLRWG
jgi:hypothetical protein